MCGIAGSIWTSPKLAINPDILRKMMAALRHRGPDDEGELFQDCTLHNGNGSTPGVALGFRRLSIIDLQTGNQPLGNEDGSIQVIFNGEIYNFALWLVHSGHCWEMPAWLASWGNTLAATWDNCLR